MILRNCLKLKGASLLLCVAAIAAAGCSLFNPDEQPPVVTPPPPRDTPEGAVQYFVYVQEAAARSLEEYDRVLHSLYRFYFTPEDRGEDPTLPEFWVKQEDVDATANMFAGAVTISMNIIIVDTVAVEPCFDAPDTATCTLFECDIKLNVEVPEEPENRTYTVDGVADIAVTRDEFDPNLYVIAQIVDHTLVAGGGGERQSLAERRSRLAEPAPGSPLASAQQVSWGELREILAAHAP